MFVGEFRRSRGGTAHAGLLHRRGEGQGFAEVRAISGSGRAHDGPVRRALSRSWRPGAVLRPLDTRADRDPRVSLGCPSGGAAASAEYQSIAALRVEGADTRAILVEGLPARITEAVVRPSRPLLARRRGSRAGAYAAYRAASGPHRFDHGPQSIGLAPLVLAGSTPSSQVRSHTRPEPTTVPGQGVHWRTMPGRKMNCQSL